MPNERYLDANGLNTFWGEVKNYVDEKIAGGTTFLVRAPIGTIVIWSGTVDDIPTGWQLCDGTNGTPDLQDKFVLGAGPNHAVGSVGGEETVTLTVDQMPSHSHVPKLYATSTTISNYKHGNTTSGNVSYYSIDYTAIRKNTGTSVKDVSTSLEGGDSSHNNMPPYYALCYIMKLVADPTDGVTQEELTTALSTKQDALSNGTGTTVENNSVNVTTPVQGVKTQAEFDALPADDQNKGLWVISNGESGGSSAGGEIYSTEETRIGTWIDGKPLYRKTMLYPELLTKNDTGAVNGNMIQISNTNSKTIVNYYGTVRDATNNKLYGSIPWVALSWLAKGTWGVDITENVDSYFLSVRGQSDSAVSKLTISVTLTIEYTKPADQPEVIT